MSETVDCDDFLRGILNFTPVPETIPPPAVTISRVPEQMPPPAPPISRAPLAMPPPAANISRAPAPAPAVNISRAPAANISRAPLAMPPPSVLPISRAPVQGTEQQKKRAKRTYDETRPSSTNNISHELIANIYNQYKNILELQINVLLTILIYCSNNSADKVTLAQQAAKMGLLHLFYRTNIRNDCFVPINTPLEITRSFLQCNPHTYGEKKYIVSEKITILFHYRSNSSVYYVVVDIKDFDELPVFTFQYSPVSIPLVY